MQTALGNWDAEEIYINAGLYTGWESNNAPAGPRWNLQLYNQQTLEIQGLVAQEMHWNSNTVRIEQAEPPRAMFGIAKDTAPANYGFMREYHLFTTKQLTQTDLDDLFSQNDPLLPGMVGSELNENQLVYGVAREYTTVANLISTDVFMNDWRLSPTFQNMLGNGYPVAQGRIFYTRAIWCWLNSAGLDPNTSPAQGVDIPAARVSLMGEVVKPKNFNDHMAVLGNNEGIGTW